VDAESADDQKALTMLHELKAWPKFFNMVNLDLKTFELRKDDRGFELGDTLVLKEYEPENQSYTGNEIRVFVQYILRHEDMPDGLVPGYVVLGFEVLARYIVK
jgi:hypothetical protein